MAIQTYNLGTVTAYADAKAGGYRGTKAEWQALMANYATVGQQAAQDAQTASQAAQTATTKAGEASQSATRAETAAASITTPDTTLTQAGVAADAKATGDEIEVINTSLDSVQEDVSNISTELTTNFVKSATGTYLFRQGGYARNGRGIGKSSASYVYYLVSSTYIDDQFIKFVSGDGYYMSLWAWNGTTFAGFLHGDKILSTNSSDSIYWLQDIDMNEYRSAFPNYSFKLQIANASTAGGTGSAISPSEGDNITSYYKSNNNIENYYASEMETTINVIRNASTEPCLVFPIITDIHYFAVNALFDKCINNIKYLTGKIKCDFLLNLGDNTDGDVSQIETISRAYHMLDRFAEINLPYYQAIGNHDTNSYGTLMTSDQIFSAYLSNTRGVQFNSLSGEKDFYKDFDELGIRLIVLDNNHNETYGYSVNTGTWLSETALQTDKIVILVGHLSVVRSQNWSNVSVANSASVLSAVQTFVNNGGTVIEFSGHSHADYYYTSPWLSIHHCCQKFIQEDSTDSGYSIINETASGVSFPERTLGTYTEDLWSVVVVKPLSRKVNLIRFGAGNDREFTF